MKARPEIAKLMISLSLLLVPAWFAGCGGGGGGGGGTGSGSSGAGGDSAFFLDEVFFGRPLFDPDGMVIEVTNPKSVIEEDPITGLLLAGFPKPLFPGDDLEKLMSLNLGETPNSPFKVRVVPRNGVLVLSFTKPVDPDSLLLDPEGLVTAKSPIRIVTDEGSLVTCRASVHGKEVWLNPVVGDQVGFPPSPLVFDQNGDPISSAEGFLKLLVYSAGTATHVVEAAQGGLLSTRKDLLGSPLKPIGFNPGNSGLDFFNYGEGSFNGFLPDISPPRIIREVKDGGTAGAGSGTLQLVDPTKSFVTAANGGSGEWSGALLVLRPGAKNEEKVKVASNTETTLFVDPPGFTKAPQAGKDAYELIRAEFYEPIPGFTDLTTAVDPVNIPKDPNDPEDAKNSDLFNFVYFDAYNETKGAWESVDYDPGPDGSNPIGPRWRINLRFSEPMDLGSFRPYETFYVCSGSLSVEDPGFGKMMPGRVTIRNRNREVSFEPVVDDQTGAAGGDRLLGFGVNPKALRLVIRVVPPAKAVSDFYESLGPPSTWPPGVVEDLVKTGVLGLMNLGGQPLGLPAQFLQKESPYCVIFDTSPGHGAYPPSADFRYDFSTQADPEGTEEYGVLVHRFMGLPETGVGPEGETGVIYQDHPGLIYGPHIADCSVGLNGFLSGHYVEFIEHVFDNYNPPPPSSPTYPDPINPIPFGVGTPVTANDGCRFQHVYRVGDCSPDVPSFQGTVLDLIGLAWAPIGGWVTNTLIENMSIVIGNSKIVPDTTQEAGIPNSPGSGLKQTFSTNFFGKQYMVVGEETPPTQPNIGVPYVIDWRNLFGPKNHGPKFNNYIAWPTFDRPKKNPGFPFTSEYSMVIEYRLDHNQGSSMAQTNGFTFHAGIISSMLPRFRVYSRGPVPNTTPPQMVDACSYPQNYPSAWGPLQSPGSYGDNSRYFLIFEYVKRISTVVAPYLNAEDVTQDIQFFQPVIVPPLTDIPAGTTLTVEFQVNPNPSNPGSPVSPWTVQEQVEGLNDGPYANYDYIRFKAVFEANVAAGVVPAIDTLTIPYKWTP